MLVIPLRFAIVLLAGLSLTGCSADTAPPASAPPATIATSVEPSVGNLPGADACRLLRAAVTDATLMDPGVAAAIAGSAADADAPIADAAQRLLSAYDRAVASSGTEGEPDAVAAVSAAGADLTEVCDESGLDTVG